MPAFKDMQMSVQELRELVIAQHQQIEKLEALVLALRAEIEHLRRGGKRQAAPFSTGVRKPDPKKPGRKPRSDGSGSDNFARRAAPCAADFTGPIVDARVAEERCPDCGGALEPQESELATVTDLPAIIKPVVRAYRVAICCCADCGRKVRGRHPEIAVGQHGATAHRIGERAMAVAHALHFGCGVPVCKVPQIMRELCNIKLTQSAITQDGQRRFKSNLGTLYQQLRQSVKESEKAHTDDTGWRVDGESAQLMVFVTDKATVFQVRKRHRNDEVRELIPADYQGVMCTDRGKSYDARELNGVKQQKCISHVQRSIAAVLETKEGTKREFGEKLKALFKESLELWHRFHDGPTRGPKALLHRALHHHRAGRLDSRMTHYLRNREIADRDNQRLQRELGWHHARGNLLRFLHDPSIEPTNNRAERALRPAVIARKVSQCSKTQQGAEVFSAFMTVTQTLRKQRVHSLVDGLVHVFQTGSIPSALPGN